MLSLDNVCGHMPCENQLHLKNIHRHRFRQKKKRSVSTTLESVKIFR